MLISPFRCEEQIELMPIVNETRRKARALGMNRCLMVMLSSILKEYGSRHQGKTGLQCWVSFYAEEQIMVEHVLLKELQLEADAP